jgi:hypothetical protein
MRAGARIAALLALMACPVAAEGPDRSPRPLPNPAYLLPAGAATLPDAAAVAAPEALAVPAAPTPSDAGLASSLRPRARPAALEAMVAEVRTGKDGGLDLASLAVPESAPEPEPAPKSKKKKKKEEASRKGSICGVNAIKGEEIAPIRSRVKGCGLKDGVRVTSVSGVRLSQAATIDCDTARALNTWVSEVLQPAYGGAVVELRIAAHYICRPRNNKKGAKISEHGRGKAVDVAGIVLDSGKTQMVAGGYGKTLRRVHKDACGIFGTTLGPGSDGYHEDHLHFDTAGYRSGPYCR